MDIRKNQGPVKLMFLMPFTIAEPEDETVGEDAFNCALIEGGQICSGETSLPESTQRVKSQSSVSRG